MERIKPVSLLFSIVRHKQEVARWPSESKRLRLIDFRSVTNKLVNNESNPHWRANKLEDDVFGRNHDRMRESFILVLSPNFPVEIVIMCAKK